MGSQLSARQKLVSHLARKPYSARELQEKLARHFSPEEVRDACAWALEVGLIEAPEKMAVRFAEELSRKGKGPRFIAAALKKKGLPAVPFDRENDLECAKKALQRKFKLTGPLPAHLGRKAMQFLSQRGFHTETIRQAVGKIRYEDNDTAADS